MKNLFPLLFIALIYFAISCESTPVVGSEDVIVLDDARIQVDSTYIENNRFYAKGTVTNTGSDRFSPIWYVEGSFFSDAEESIKLGGNNTSFSFALERGQTALWTLYYSDGDINPFDYLEFTVSELRAYKENPKE
jgi:hypothetical protein